MRAISVGVITLIEQYGIKYSRLFELPDLPSLGILPSPASYFFWTDGTNSYRANLMSGNMIEASTVGSTITSIIEPIITGNPMVIVTRGVLNWTVTNGNVGTTSAWLRNTIIESDGNLTMQPPTPASQLLHIQAYSGVKRVLWYDQNSYGTTGVGTSPAFVNEVFNGSGATATFGSLDYGDGLAIFSGNHNMGNHGPRALQMVNLDAGDNSDVQYVSQASTIANTSAVRIVNKGTSDVALYFLNSNTTKGGALRTGTAGAEGVIQVYDAGTSNARYWVSTVGVWTGSATLPG
jgi:hypothetical protein